MSSNSNSNSNSSRATSYERLRVSELRDLCRERHLRVSGVKDELISRLAEADSQRASFEFKAESQRRRLADRGAGGEAEGDRENGDGYLSSPLQSGGLPQSDSQFDLWQRAKEQEKAEREQLVLWRRPLATLWYSCLEAKFLLTNLVLRVWQHRAATVAVVTAVLLLLAARAADGPHRPALLWAEATAAWCCWWIWLGVLSSVGLGTGLHTFLIYLGPHIATVTLAATECRSLQFPQPPYPQEVVCPDSVPPTSPAPTLLEVLAKVRLEAFCWGAGTALGELPPYFLARAARLSGMDPDSEDFDEFEELLHSSSRAGDATRLPLTVRAKLLVHTVVQRLGFWGILLCASIPNPLFDLAGITCGHFLVPFRTFFAATLVGKAVAKMHLQAVFVIFAFSPGLVQRAAELLSRLPSFGAAASRLILDLLDRQRHSLRRRPGDAGANAGEGRQSLLQQAFELLVAGMILYFLVSIVNSFAQSYYKRQYHRDRAVQLAERKTKFL